MLKLHLRWIVLLFLPFSGGLHAAENRSTPRAFIFFDSSVPEQYSIFTQFNQQYFMSSTLQKSLEVKFIDISPNKKVNSALLSIIHDSDGFWVGNFRPTKIPRLFCLKGNTRYQLELTGPGDIRKCL